jgi:hypothetical protein
MPSNAAHYSRLDRLLHHVALGWSPIAMASFDLERSRFLRSAPRNAEAPVFIAGLARAGTTLFARALDATGGFATARYRDMPFPLAPNGWAAVSQRFRKPVAAAERGHGDGMTHDLSSLEAIEEFFWRIHGAADYAKPSELRTYRPDAETLEAFADWMALIMLRDGPGRYLSKNNNNVLRLGALAGRFPEASFIHPFRDPLQQAEALLNQHLRAIGLHRDDPFRRRYMRWLGHHEFGADQRPFAFASGPVQTGDATRVDYWVSQWTNVYRALLSQPAPIAQQQLFVDFDACCRNPGQFESAAAEWLKIDVPAVAISIQPERVVAPVDSQLEAQARQVHAALVARALHG